MKLRLQLRLPTLRRARTAAPQVMRDLVGLGGFAAFVHGLQLVSVPLAWIVGGLAAAALATMLSKPAKATD